jgi:predicted HAD superfamily hydrolase
MQKSDSPKFQDPLSVEPLSSKELEGLIAQASAISFDFFDTLFARPLAHPEDAFDLLGRQLGIPEFRAMRREAQVEAFRRMQSAGRKEISLDGIYECMPGARTHIAEWMRAEYELELALVRPVPQVYALLRKTLSAGKRVVITSDMYLPLDFFRDALRPYGLDHIQLFISANRNATKRDHGSLFDIVSAELGLRPEHILHIGDSQLADVSRARERGFTAYLYQSQRMAAVEKNASLLTSVGYGMLCNEAPEVPMGSFSELGFVYGGAANFGFLEWIRDSAQLDGIDKILFFSRDGYNLKRIETAQPRSVQVDCNYFLGSRTAFSMAAIRSENYEQYIPFLMSGADGLATHEVLERIGVQPPAPKVMANLGLGADVKVGPAVHALLKQFLLAYRRQILMVCQRNRRGLYLYLREAGVKPGSRVAIVDVGWSGTTQEAFEAAVRPMIDIDVVGYYFCLANTPERHGRSARQTMKAFVNEGNTSEEVVAAVYANRVAVEQFFSAPHSSIIGYETDSGNVRTIADMGRGDTTALHKTSAEVCDGVLAFAKHFKAFQQRIGVEPAPLEFVSPLLELLANTKSTPYQLLGSVRNFDAWGSSKNHVLTLKNYLPGQ